MKFFIQTLVLLFLLIISNHVNSQWISDGGPITDISVKGMAYADSFLFASTPCGIYISNNSGKSWNAYHYYTFSSHLFFKDTLIIADNGYRENKGIAKLFRSDNSWKHKWANYNPRVHGLYTDNVKIYAATETDGVIFSENTTTWEKMNAGLPLDTNSITTQPYYYLTAKAYCISGNNQYLFAGTRNGVFRNGKNKNDWENVSNEMGKTAVTALYCSDSVLIAANLTGIYKSVDNGNKWEPVMRIEANSKINNFEFIDNKLFALSSTEGIFISHDLGENWSTINEGLCNLNITSIVKTGNNWFTGTGQGVFTEYGKWKNSSSGIVCSSVFELLRTDSSLVSINLKDVFVKNGQVWINTTEDISKDYFSSVIYANRQLLFAADITGAYQSDCRVYRSENSGKSWSVVSTLEGFDDSYHLRTNGSEIIAFEDDVLLLSKDGAKTWENISPPKGMGCNNVNDAIFFGNDIFMALCGTKELLRSTDQGTTWNFANIGLPSSEIYNLETCCNIIFADTESGLYQSADNGISWKYSSTGIPKQDNFLTAQIDDVICNENLFFLCTCNKVYASSSKGQTWSDISNGLPPLPQGIGKGSLLLTNDTLYFGTNNFGIWKQNIKNLFIPDVKPDSLISITISPNPTNDNVSIRIENEFRAEYVEVYHLSGKIVNTLVPYNNQINIADLPAGVYILKVLANDKFYFSKVIKTNRFQ